MSIEKCAAECSIVAGLDEQTKTRLLEGCAQLCIGAVKGPIGTLCGAPSDTPDAAAAKNDMTRNALSEIRLNRLTAELQQMSPTSTTVQ